MFSGFSKHLQYTDLQTKNPSFFSTYFYHICKNRIKFLIYFKVSGYYEVKCFSSLNQPDKVQHICRLCHVSFETFCAYFDHDCLKSRSYNIKRSRNNFSVKSCKRVECFVCRKKFRYPFEEELLSLHKIEHDSQNVSTMYPTCTVPCIQWANQNY